MKPKIIEERKMTVAKHNDLIRLSKYDLSTQAQKLLLYLISKIKPGDPIDTLYTFDAQTLCEVCGIQITRKTCADFMRILQELADNGFWLQDGTKYIRCHWLSKAIIDTSSKTTACIRFDPDLQPYLIDLRSNYTAYEFEYVLAMRSKYGIRLYELLKSYAFAGETEITIAELREHMVVDGYPEYCDFKKRVLDVAVREINDYTDLLVDFSMTRRGRVAYSIHFSINRKNEAAKLAAFANRHEVLNND